MIEFVFDTTRTIASLLYSGTLARYPSIRFIFPHAGGTLPFVAGRVAMGEIKPHLRERVPEGALHYLRRLYFDTALSTTESALAALTTFAPPTQIVFGSDIPMAPVPLVAAWMADLDSSPTLDAATRAAIDRENALRLFPRFARVAVNS